MHNLKLVNAKEQGLLNVKEAAVKLGVTEKTIRKWQYERKIPFIKLFGAIRFDSEELNRLIQRSKISQETA